MGFCGFKNRTEELEGTFSELVSSVGLVILPLMVTLTMIVRIRLSSTLHCLREFMFNFNS